VLDGELDDLRPAQREMAAAPHRTQRDRLGQLARHRDRPGRAAALGGRRAADVATLQSRPDGTLFMWIALAGGFGSSWLATILWNVASQRLSASLCGQLIVSETLFALLYSFVWDGRWPQATEWVAALLFVLGILASIKAHR
jgi:hypothetical protein